MIADALSPSPTSFLALTLNSYVAPFSEIIRVKSEHSFLGVYFNQLCTYSGKPKVKPCLDLSINHHC